MGLVVLVKKMSVLINFLLQNTNLVSVLSKICPIFAGHVWQDRKICPIFAGHVWQDRHISWTLILYKQTWNMLSKLDFSLFFIIKKSSYERNNFLIKINLKIELHFHCKNIYIYDLFSFLNVYIFYCFKVYYFC